MSYGECMMRSGVEWRRQERGETAFAAVALGSQAAKHHGSAHKRKAWKRKGGGGLFSCCPAAPHELCRTGSAQPVHPDSAPSSGSASPS